MQIKEAAGRRRWLDAMMFAVLAVLSAGAVWLGRSAEFGIKLNSITNTSVSLTITNGASTNFYEIFGTSEITSSAPVSITATGALGQTNFTISRGVEARRFFKATINNDWDGDGILNIRDADPRNASVNNVLTITIRTPTNGANIQ